MSKIMIESKRFIRKKEDFTCNTCGLHVKGNGYSNHCSSCLWSRHVDYNPGDRLNSCGGMMEPVGLVTKHGKEYVVHKCVVCGGLSQTKKLAGDSQEVSLRISSNVVPM